MDNDELLDLLKEIYPVLLEAREAWSNGEDCYSEAEEKVKEVIDNSTSCF